MRTSKGEIITLIAKQYGFKVIKSNGYIKKADNQTFTKLIEELFKTKDMALLKIKLKDFFTKAFSVYLSGIFLKDVLKERQDILGVKSLEEKDLSLIDNVLSSDILWNSYVNVGEDITNKINTLLSTGMQQGKSNYQIRQEIVSQIKDITKARANTIIRTERNNIQNLSREQIYKEIAPDGLFFMQGPDDNRTAESTKRVKKRIGKGKTIEEIKQIIKEEADQKTYLESRPFVIHINTRHKLAKVV